MFVCDAVINFKMYIIVKYFTCILNVYGKIHNNHPNLEMKCCCYSRVALCSSFFLRKALERMQTRRIFLFFASKIVLVLFTKRPSRDFSDVKWKKVALL